MSTVRRPKMFISIHACVVGVEVFTCRSWFPLFRRWAFPGAKCLGDINIVCCRYTNIYELSLSIRFQQYLCAGLYLAGSLFHFLQIAFYTPIWPSSFPSPSYFFHLSRTDGIISLQHCCGYRCSFVRVQLDSVSHLTKPFAINLCFQPILFCHTIVLFALYN